MDRSRVVLAELFRPRGIHGELLARSQTDIPGRLEQLKSAWVQLTDGTDREVVIESAWLHKDLWVLKLAGIDSIDEAQPLSGADLWVKPEERAPLEEGQFYQSDLIGCKLFSEAGTEPVGVVEGWQDYGGRLLMQVDRQGREVLVPFRPELCRKVDLVAKSIWMDLPDGLLDL